MLQISLDEFRKSIPANKEPELWLGYASEFFPRYEITTNIRIAGFVTQTGHESSDMTRYIESTNYSWDRLIAVFGRRYFPTDSFAKQYHRDSKKIANYVYSDHTPARTSKLGNVHANDGWNFRGSGLIQLTGRYNISDFAKSVDMTPEDAAVYCRTKRGAFHSACWFWHDKGLNRFCDANDITGMSKGVNGGSIGLKDRKDRWTRNTKLDFLSSTEYPTVSLWARGDIVKRIQKATGITGRDLDGIYGPTTLRHVKIWQVSEGFTANGTLNNIQLKKMLG